MPATARKTKARKTTAAKRKPKLRVVKKSTARKPASKTTARKSTARKTTARKSTARKTSASKPVRKTTARKSTARKSMAKKAVSRGAISVGRNGIRTKSELFNVIAENCELGKKDVANVFDALGDVIGEHIKKRGPGKFTIPGMMKIDVRIRPATKARKGINPFTGEETMFKAKPASRRVKITALKKLKDMAK